MESFYGGRQGSSFVIKKRFDYIGEKDKNFYKYNEYLYDINKRGFLVDDAGDLIPKVENQEIITPTSHTQKWKILLCDGKVVDKCYKLSTGEEHEKKVYTPEIKAETMLDCFMQGGATTNIVNYGEYVIIDAQRPDEKAFVDGKEVYINGRVYRRGLPIDNDPMAGAEYIGQFIGAQGQSPELFFDKFENIENYNEVTSEHDEIHVIQGTANNADETVFKIRSEKETESLDGVNEYRIGWQIPYSGFQFNSVPIDYNKVTEVREKAGHNFFHPYEITIADGVPGDDINNVFEVCEYVDTYSQRENLISVYDKNNNIIGKITPNQQAVKTIINDLWIDKTKDKVEIDLTLSAYPSEKCYVSKDDTCKLALYKKVTKYSKEDENDSQGNPIPTVKYIKIAGGYKRVESIELIPQDRENEGLFTINFQKDASFSTNIAWVKNLTLSPTGIVTEHFTGGKESQTINENNPLKWIKNTKLSDTGTLTVTYNTIDKNTQRNESEDIKENIQWIEDVNLENNGKVKVTYNTKTNNIQNSEYINNNNPIKWINNISFSEEGKLLITFNTQETFNNNNNPIKWINNAILNNNGQLQFVLNTKTNGVNNVINANPNNPIEWIKEVKLSEEGILQVVLNTNKTLDANSKDKNPLRWITNAEFTDNGKLQIDFNIGDPIIKENIKWITDVKFDHNGKFKIDFNIGNSIEENIKWIESTVIVDKTQYEYIINNITEKTAIPNIGDVLVKYNMDNKDSTGKFYYPWEGTLQKVWTRVGIAQNLTGLKIFMTAKNLNDIPTEKIEAIPAGWGIFVPLSTNSETGEDEPAFVVIKNTEGYSNPNDWPKIFIDGLGIGGTPELIFPTNYASGVQNLEQELIFGKDKYVEEYYDEQGNKIVETSYCNEDILETLGEKYYKVKTITYNEENIKSEQRVENGVLYLSSDKNIKLENNVLYVATNKTYKYDKENGLTIAAEHIIKEEMLYLVTVGAIEELILTKTTIKQEFANGRTVIKEINNMSNVSI